MIQSKTFELQGKPERAIDGWAALESMTVRKAKKAYPALHGFFSYALIGESRPIVHCHPEGSMRVTRIR